jgi:predicted nucleic acid-binding protein
MKAVVADSSFYLCFLEDIEQPRYLIPILDSFEFLMPSIVHAEVRRCNNYRYIRGNQNITIVDNDFKTEEVLRPLFSSEQWKKGEAQAIALAFELNVSNSILNLILDDVQARTFVQRNLAFLKEIMTGTLGFLVVCYQSQVLSKEDTSSILDWVEKSQFRVTDEVLSIIRLKIQSG